MNSEYIKTRPKAVVNVTKIVTIHYYEFGKDFVFDGESHDFWEMVYVDKGSVAIKCDDSDEIILRQGQVIFHRPFEFHTIRSYESSPNVFVISFVSSSLSMVHFERFRAYPDNAKKNIISSIIDEAEKSYDITTNDPALRRLTRKKSAPLGSEQLIKNYLEMLLISFLRSIESEKKDIIPLAVETEPLISAIKEYINSRREENIRIEEICSAFGYSKSFLCHFFKKHTSDSLSSYANKVKMTRAKELLRDNTLNISQISSILSFENPQYFARAFKRDCGMTPTEWKRKVHIK